MNSGMIVHEWFYPDGPDTFEYKLPVERFSEDHEAGMPQWIRQFASLSREASKQAFREYLQSTDHRDFLAFTKLLELLTPYSVVVHESSYWLLCKLENQFDELSEHGNMLQLSGPHQSVEWPPFFNSENMASLKHFLTYFGDTRIDVPPTCGIVSPRGLEPAIEDLETYAWKNIGHWSGAYPVYDVGNGDCVLVRADGIYGLWCHELCDEPTGAVRELGAFSKFIEFVAKETGIGR